MTRLLAVAVLLLIVVGALLVWRQRAHAADPAPIAASPPDAHDVAAPHEVEPAANVPAGSEREPALATPPSSATDSPRATVGELPALRPSSSATIAGHVVRPDGAPACGAEVRLESDGPFRSQLGPLASTRTERDGAFEFTAAYKGPFRVQAIDAETRANEESGADAVLEHVLPVRLDLVLVLPGPSVLRGIVMDDVGVAVPDFQLECWRDDVNASNPRLPPRKRFQDPSGAFELDNLALGEWSLKFRRKREDPWTTARATLPLVEPLVLVLPRPAIVHGLVVDPSERPVAGASIECWPETVRSEKDGAFVLHRAPASGVELYATHAGYAPSNMSSFSLEPRQELDCVLRLRPLAHVTGDVIGLDGRPLASREVSAYHPLRIGLQSTDDVAEANDKTVTDAEGRFTLDVAPGEVDVDVELSQEEIHALELERGAHGSAGRSCTRGVTLGPGETAEIRLVLGGRPVRLHGRVTLGGKPAQELAVHVASFGDWDDHSVAKGNGMYETLLPCPGHHLLCLYGIGNFCTQCTLEVPEVDEFRFDVALPLGKLSGRVTDAAGSPLEDVTLDAGEERVNARTSNRATTDRNGEYSMELVPGFYRVSARGFRASTRVPGG